jgi:hypothetical protein
MGFFDVGDRLAELSKKGDPLERLSRTVDFELFRPELEQAVPRSDRARGGRPPYDHVVMFKVLVIQTLYTLSDEQTEFQIKDRLSFQRFLGLGLGDTVPDANTIWTFREALTRAKAVEGLFGRRPAARASSPTPLRPDVVVRRQDKPTSRSRKIRANLPRSKDLVHSVSFWARARLRW